MDAQIHWDPLGTPSCWNGVTSVVMGNCGFTLAPCAPAAAPLVIRNLERAEDIPGAAMAAGIRWTWETFPEYLDMLDRLPKGINYATYVGHSALRTWAMGERAFEQSASERDLTRMSGQLREAMQAGAMGLSTSRGNHETSDSRPVASRLASWDELRRLVNVAGESSGAIFETTQEGGRSADPEARADYNARLRDLAVESGVTLTCGVSPMSAAPDAWKEKLELVDQVAAAGGTAVGQSHSRGPNVFLSFLTQMPYDRLPEWSALRRKPIQEQARLLADPEIRAQLVRAARDGNYGRAIGAEAKRPDYDLMSVYDDTLEPGPSIAAIAAQRGVHPVEAVIDLALERGLNRFFVQANTRQEAETTVSIMRHPRTVMTFSDAGAHVSQIADSSIHAHLLAYWVNKRSVFSVEEAVRMITFAPARAWGLARRGLVAPGMIADLNVINLPALKPEVPRVASDLPTGARRLIQRCAGIRATIVGGQVLLDEGEHTGAFPGQLIRRGMSN
jgi:N-acyl-D-aspartate/D-glutamate deacylase